MTILPRELRDLVYMYLADHRFARHAFEIWPCIASFAANAAPSTFPDQHCVEDAAFVDRRFARELVQMYYQCCTFVLRDADLAGLESWLGLDTFGLGVLVGEHVQCVDVQCTFGFSGKDWGADWESGLDDVKARGLVVKQARELGERLAPLAQIT